jgi:hypothetical protein
MAGVPTLEVEQACTCSYACIAARVTFVFYLVPAVNRHMQWPEHLNLHIYIAVKFWSANGLITQQHNVSSSSPPQLRQAYDRLIASY